MDPPTQTLNKVSKKKNPWGWKEMQCTYIKRISPSRKARDRYNDILK